MLQTKVIRGLLGCIALLGLHTAQADDLSDVDDLVDVYQQALQQDAQLRAADAAFQAAQEAKPQAWAPLLPQLDVSGSYTYNDTETVSPDAPPPFNSRALTLKTGAYTLSLNQVIYHHDLIVQLKQADSSIAQAAAERQAAQQALILRVAQAYFDVLAAQDNLEFARAEKQAIARQLDQADKRFEVGLIPITDVKEAQASYDLAVAQEIDAQNQLDVAFEGLRVITGQEYGRISGLSDRLKLIRPEPDDISQWVDTAVDNNLELAAAEFAAKTANLEIRRQRAGHYPTLDLIASKQETEDFGGDLDDRTSDDESIAVQINIPIFSGGLTSSLTREAHAEFSRTRQLAIQQRRETIQQTRGSYLNVLAGISRVKALRQAVISNKAAADAAEAGFEVGTRTSVDVLLALRDLFSAQRDYARARYDYLVDTLTLKQAAGTVSAQDVYDINRFIN